MFDVQVNIDLTRPIGTVGFGIPLILVENAASAVEYIEVSNLADVLTAGFESTTDVYGAAQLIFKQKTAPKSIAICAATGDAPTALADDMLTGKGWRQLIVINDGETASTITAISNAVEELDGKLYFAGLETDDTTAITVTDLRRTILFYCNVTADAPVPVAALVGESAGRAAGSFTYKNLILSGIAAQELTDAQVTAIHNKGGITFVNKAGDNVTSEGKVAGGEYIDIIDSEDYIIQQLTYKTQKLINNASKIPYDNNGIAMLETVAIDVLQGAFNNGMIAVKADGTPDFTISYALREDTSDADRSNRRYLGGSFTFALAGAIHQAEITGSITV